MKLIGLECGVNFEYALIKEFNIDNKEEGNNFNSETSKNVYSARLWAKNPSDKKEGLPPHKRIRYILSVPEQVLLELNVNNPDEFKRLYEISNKIPTPWGCWNREIKDTYRVKDGFDIDGKMRFVNLPFILTKECVFSKDHPNDRSCIGCKNINS